MGGYEWDPAKAQTNRQKHGVDFADAAVSLEDPNALVVPDPDARGEERYVCLGADPAGHILVTVFTYRGENVRIVSARSASAGERLRYEES
jgi:uncharacterized DUF497 family protein